MARKFEFKAAVKLFTLKTLLIRCNLRNPGNGKEASKNGGKTLPPGKLDVATCRVASELIELSTDRMPSWSNLCETLTSSLTQADGRLSLMDVHTLGKGV